MGGLRLVTSKTAALNVTLLVTLRGPWGGESFARATSWLPDGMAQAIDGNAEEHLAHLVAGRDKSTDEWPEKNQNIWDRIRALSPMENSCWP